MLVDPAELAAVVKAAVAEALGNRAGGELVGVGGAASIIGISERTVWRLDSASASTGFPRSLRLGRSAKWKRSEIVAWLDRLESGQVIEIPTDD